MKKAQIIENENGFKAVNAFIFAGSFSLGVMRAGFDLRRVLEISDDQPKQNAFYFMKNVEDVPVVLPSKWENDEYLASMKDEDIDLMCCNCPCSSLSQINRNASVDGKNNVHFYRLFNVFQKAQPKAFVIENAPTLIKLGFPILKNLVKQLSSIYRFTIIRDCAGNHDVAMQRMRTLVVGWRRDYFIKIPLVKMDKHKQTYVKECLGDIYEDTTNDNPSKIVDSISSLYKYAKPGEALMKSLAYKYNDGDESFISELKDATKDTPFMKEIVRVASKLKAKQNIWDKSPYKLVDDKHFPSLTSVNEYLHPHQDRTLNLREVARIMNYPDWYDFHDEKHETTIPVTQAIAQGVPANFGKYIASQVCLGLKKELKTIDDENVDIVFQNHTIERYKEYTKDEFMQLAELKVSNKDSKKIIEKDEEEC